MFNRLLLPPYESLKEYEGKGNYAIGKYYKFPYRLFYRHKLKMLVDMMDRRYDNCLDFGSGPGILIPELTKHANRVTGYELGDPIDSYWRFDLIVCSSVLEFCNLDTTLKFLKGMLKPNGHLIVASPMQSTLSKAYFDSIKDSHERHSHIEIIRMVSEHFTVLDKKEWAGLYFSLKATK